MNCCDILVVTDYEGFNKKNPVDTFKILTSFFQDLKVSVEIQVGPEYRKEASAVLNHVNLTETPPQYQALFRNYKTGINTRLLNIRKSVICDDATLSKPGKASGPVIVKTDLNYGGIPELQRLQWQGDISQGVINQTYANARYLNPNSYPIFNDSSMVPAGVWENPNLIVQNLYIEQDSIGRYCLRSWYVLGDAGFHVMTVANHPVVKGQNILDRWVLDVETPRELMELKQRLALDYGRIDYTLHRGKAIVFDANRTPTSSIEAVDRYHLQWQSMASGIKQYLG
ncbi:hypothetical protein N9N71_01810 [Synechococcus sp. AH-229-G18]|nr:hypothetical protein [Synechococcus sp. AH-229-G18]